MSVSELSNTPLDFTIGNKIYKIKKLSILDVFGSTEKKIKEEYVSNITSMSSSLPKDERNDFLKSAIKEMPSGKKLEEMVNDKINTTSGGIDILFIILNKCQEVIMDELMALVSDDKNSNVISSIMSYALGQKEEEPKDKDEDNKDKKK